MLSLTLGRRRIWPCAAVSIPSASCQRGSDHPGQRAIFTSDDLMSAHGLPGAAEVAVQPEL